MKYVVKVKHKEGGGGAIVCQTDSELLEAIKQGLTLFGVQSLIIEEFKEYHYCDDDCPEHGWRAP